MSNRSNEKRQGCYFTTALGTVPFVLLVRWLWPSVIPFEFFHFWRLEGSFREILINSWPLFAWGAGVTLALSLLTRNRPDENRDAEAIWFIDLGRSIRAGVFEEISFRWLFFYSGIIGVLVANFLLLGFAGVDIVKWVYGQLLVPLADTATLHHLHPFLYGSTWAVGAAMITSNGKFRDGHSYLGLLGWVNSWFCGMFFFWLMFTHGLPAAIVVHAVYDVIVFTVRYIDRVVERARGWA